jgi:hypothetical protein
MASIISENEIQLNPELVTNIQEHCENLITDFKEHFPENLTPEFCIRDTFATEDTLSESVRTNKKDELIELPCDGCIQR